MAQNGFRLFVVSLHDNLKREEQPFNAAQARTDDEGTKPAPVCYTDLVPQLVAENLDQTFNIGLPADTSDTAHEAATTKGSSTRLLGATTMNLTSRIWFHSGPINVDGISADPEGQSADVPLAGRSTLHDYRASLVTMAGGTRAILAVETRGGSCPWRPLIRALVGCSPIPWRLRPHDNVADAASVKAFIQRAEVEEVNLAYWTFDSDGNRDVQLRGLFTKMTPGQQGAAKSRLAKWSNIGKQKEIDKWKKEAKEVEGEFFSSGINLEFNDVAMVVNDGMQRRTLKPSTDYNKFTYHLGTSIVDDTTFFSQAEGAATLLLPNIQPPPPVHGEG